MQASTVPPLAHEIACSGPRPPNTTATRILRFWFTPAPLRIAVQGLVHVRDQVLGVL